MKKRNLIIGTLVAVALTSNLYATTPTSANNKVDNGDASYTFGYSMGKQVSNQINTTGSIVKSKFMDGFTAAINGTKPTITEAQMKESVQAFQVQMQKELQVKQIKAVLNNKDKLLNNPSTPTVNPKNAKVAVIEFYDYQCAFCSLVFPAIEKVMTDNKNVKFIFKDFPIFGKKWAASNYAAEMGNVAYKQGGSELFIKLHNSIFETHKDEGKLTNDDINAIAKKLDINLNNKAAKTLLTGGTDLPEQIKANFTLAESLGFQGTPAIVVMPINGANADNITVFAGFPGNPQNNPTGSSVKSIQNAIAKAQNTK